MDNKIKMCSSKDHEHNIQTSFFVGSNNFWDNGQILKILFMEGTEEEKRQVEEFAREWERYVNLSFDFGEVSNEDADIRITFKKESGSWSKVGKTGKMIDPKYATMNFGWIDRSTVLHEFGHALGLYHEHQNPVNNIPWDEKAVIDYYKKLGGDWKDEEHIREQVLNRTNSTNYSIFDPLSIMCYPISNDLTLGDYEISWNTNLSFTDKVYMQKQYPFPNNSIEVKNGDFIETKYDNGVLEVFIPNTSTGISHFWWNRNHSGMPFWRQAKSFGQEFHFESCSAIQSSYGTPGIDEVIARCDNTLFHFWRDENDLSWHKAKDVCDNITGNHDFIQSNIGNKGNHEVIAPLTNGGLVHFSRINDQEGKPWQQMHIFGNGYQYSSVNICQSTQGINKNNLIVLARVNTEVHCYIGVYDSLNDSISHYEGPHTIVQNVTGEVRMHEIENGLLEVIVPDPDLLQILLFEPDTNYGWSTREQKIIADNLFNYSNAFILRSNYSDNQNIPKTEVLAQSNNEFHYFYYMNNSWSTFNTVIRL
ncbi:M12 family metallopeptidase [Bacillus sp. FSL R10-2789]|uniref:M12 family metallopeptidase n=1 Tax=Bacillus sp. FSL R10-2789 TaxID=2954662 RepID=UPI0030FB14B0